MMFVALLAILMIALCPAVSAAPSSRQAVPLLAGNLGQCTHALPTLVDIPETTSWSQEPLEIASSAIVSYMDSKTSAQAPLLSKQHEQRTYGLSFTIQLPDTTLSSEHAVKVVDTPIEMDWLVGSGPSRQTITVHLTISAVPATISSKVSNALETFTTKRDVPEKKSLPTSEPTTRTKYPGSSRHSASVPLTTSTEMPIEEVRSIFEAPIEILTSTDRSEPSVSLEGKVIAAQPTKEPIHGEVGQDDIYSTNAPNAFAWPSCAADRQDGDTLIADNVKIYTTQLGDGAATGNVDAVAQCSRLRLILAAFTPFSIFILLTCYFSVGVFMYLAGSRNPTGFAAASIVRCSTGLEVACGTIAARRPLYRRFSDSVCKKCRAIEKALQSRVDKVRVAVCSSFAFESSLMMFQWLASKVRNLWYRKLVRAEIISADIPLYCDYAQDFVNAHLLCQVKERYRSNVSSMCLQSHEEKVSSQQSGDIKARPSETVGSVNEAALMTEAPLSTELAVPKEADNGEEKVIVVPREQVQDPIVRPRHRWSNAFDVDTSIKDLVHAAPPQRAQESTIRHRGTAAKRNEINQMVRTKTSSNVTITPKSVPTRNPAGTAISIQPSVHIIDPKRFMLALDQALQVPKYRRRAAVIMQKHLNVSPEGAKRLLVQINYLKKEHLLDLQEQESRLSREWEGRLEHQKSCTDNYWDKICQSEWDKAIQLTDELRCSREEIIRIEEEASKDMQNLRDKQRKELQKKDEAWKALYTTDMKEAARKLAAADAERKRKADIARKAWQLRVQNAVQETKGVQEKLTVATTERTKLEQEVRHHEQTAIDSQRQFLALKADSKVGMEKLKHLAWSWEDKAKESLARVSKLDEEKKQMISAYNETIERALNELGNAKKDAASKIEMTGLLENRISQEEKSEIKLQAQITEIAQLPKGSTQTQQVYEKAREEGGQADIALFLLDRDVVHPESTRTDEAGFLDDSTPQLETLESAWDPENFGNDESDVTLGSGIANLQVAVSELLTPNTKKPESLEPTGALWADEVEVAQSATTTTRPCDLSSRRVQLIARPSERSTASSILTTVLDFSHTPTDTDDILYTLGTGKHVPKSASLTKSADSESDYPDGSQPDACRMRQSSTYPAKLTDSQAERDIPYDFYPPILEEARSKADFFEGDMPLITDQMVNLPCAVEETRPMLVNAKVLNLAVPLFLSSMTVEPLGFDIMGKPKVTFPMTTPGSTTIKAASRTKLTSHTSKTMDPFHAILKENWKKFHLRNRSRGKDQGSKSVGERSLLNERNNVED